MFYYAALLYPMGSLASDICSALTANDAAVLSNEFVTSRGFADYRRYLSPNFHRDLRRLSAAGRWLDVGAGQANAVRDAFHDRLRGVLSFGWQRFAGYAVGYSIAKPGSVALARFERRCADRFTYVAAGRPIEAVEPGELGQFEVISDLFTALTYGRSLADTLRAYADLSTVGGKVHAYLPEEDWTSSVVGSWEPGLALARTDQASSVLLTITDQSGRTVTFDTWMRAVRGFDLVTLKRIESTRGTGWQLELERNHLAFWAPSMDVEVVENSTPPVRRFRLK